MDIECNTKFVNKHLINVEWNKKDVENWQVKGMLKNVSNQIFTFDIRNLKDYNGELAKKITLPNKADKILIENEKKWVIIDSKELFKFFKKNKEKKIYIKDLLNKIDWNIIINK
jgi:hypothetical protein